MLGLVHDHQPVAQLLGLVHVVRGEAERHAPSLEPVQPVPEQVAGLRVQAGRRLVQEQQVRLVDQRPGDHQAPLHPARERLDTILGPLGQLHEIEQLDRPAPRLLPRPGRSSGRRSSRFSSTLSSSSSVSACGTTPRRARMVGPSRAGSRPKTVSVPSADRRDGADHAHRRGLAGAVGAQEPERLAGRHVEIHAVHGRERAEPLGQAAGMDQGFGGGAIWARRW